MDKQYNSQADVFGSAGGDCLNQYKYKTYGTSRECNVPWYYHKWIAGHDRETSDGFYYTRVCYIHQLTFKFKNLLSDVN